MLFPINQTLSPFNNKINNIYNDLYWYQINGIMPIVAYQPYGATSYANSLINLVDPGTLDVYNDDSSAGDPNWSSANGWEFDGTGSLNTHINAYTIQPVAVIAKYSYLTIAAGYLFGAYTSASSRWHWGINSPYNLISNGGSFVGVTGISTAAVVGYSGANAFKDGSKISTVVPTGTKPNANIQIGGLGYAGDYTQYRLTFNMQAIAIYDQTLTDTQMQTLTTRLQGL